jgi:iron(III) transport system substrate-binding protein
MKSTSIPALSFALTVLAALVPGAGRAEEVNIYSARQEHLMRPLLDAFTKKTGITVNLVSAGEDALIERLKSEGPNGPADILLTVDVGRLIRASESGLLQSVRSDTLAASVPSEFRDPNGAWYGLSMRARVVLYAKDRVKPQELSTYAALTDPKWKGRICVRSSSSVYNQSMLAAMIVNEGAAKAENWAKGIVANMARAPQGGDRDQIAAVAAGVCDLAIANTYYFAGMLNSKNDDERRAAEKIALFWPDQNGLGTHVNISGAGVTKSAKNAAAAIKLLEFLVSDESQRLYAEAVYEFPVKRGIKPSGLVAAWGPFKADTLGLAAIAAHQAEAIRIFDRAGWR